MVINGDVAEYWYEACADQFDSNADAGVRIMKPENGRHWFRSLLATNGKVTFKVWSYVCLGKC